MFSKKTWFVLAIAMAAWAVWHAFGTVEMVYNVRHLEDGAIRESKVVCGDAVGVVFLGNFDPDVRGPATAEDCRSMARTRLLEVGLLGLGAGTFLFLGVRYGTEPPRPIHQELPKLPGGERSVEGRRPRP